MTTAEAAVFPECVPTLKGEGIVLRAHDYKDVDRIVEQCSDALSVKFVPLPQPYTRENALGFLAEFVEKGWVEGKRFEFAIDDVSGSEPVFVGNVGVWPRGNGRFEIGWLLHPEARGHGIMTKAAHRVLKWVFEEQQAQVVLWQADANNSGSRAVASRLGFSEPAFLPSWLPIGEDLRDTHAATLTREQFESSHM